MELYRLRSFAAVAGVGRVACEVCLKEVPKSVALVAEAADYVAHFCGLECYSKWKNGGEKPRPRGPGAGPA